MGHVVAEGEVVGFDLRCEAGEVFLVRGWGAGAWYVQIEAEVRAGGGVVDCRGVRGSVVWGFAVGAFVDEAVVYVAFLGPGAFGGLDVADRHGDCCVVGLGYA